MNNKVTSLSEKRDKKKKEQEEKERDEAHKRVLKEAEKLDW